MNHRILTTLLTTFCFFEGAHAATISWSSTAYVHTTSVGASRDKDLIGVDQFDQSGTFEWAINGGRGDYGPHTLDNSTDPDIIFSRYGDAATLGITFSGFTGQGNLFHTGDVGNQVSHQAVFGGGIGTVTVGSLTVGQEYRVQVLLMDGRTSQTGKSVSFDGVNQGVYANGTAATYGDGLLVTGTFTADATTQDFTIQHSTGGTQFNAMTLYAIPEPSSVLLTALPLAGLLMGRRRA
jgi:hypothetical protein